MEDHPANRAESSGTDGYSNDPNIANEKESMSAGNPTTAPPVNANGATCGASPKPASNGDSNKESVASGQPQEAAASQEGEQSGSDDTDAEKKEVDNTEYPSGWRLLFITIALCLCVFCTALVCSIIALRLELLSAHTLTGQHDHRNGNSQDHGPVQLARRRGLVWQCIPFDDVFSNLDVWQILYLLLHQVDLLVCPFHL